MKQLYGVTVAIITPFRHDGSVDFEALQLLCEALIEAGVHALYPCGTTGEMIHMSVEERMQIAESVLKTVSRRVPVFIHTGAATPDETLLLSKHAHSVGADGIGVVTPYFLSCEDRELKQFYISVSRSLPDTFPVYLYNIPQCSANHLSPETARAIWEQTDNVAGIKYSYSDLAVTGEYLDIHPRFQVLHGCDSMFSSYLILGCAGTVSGVANVFPEPFVKVYQAFTSGDLQAVRHWQDIARRFCYALRCGANMAYFKSGLRIRGLDVGHVRAPQLDLDPAAEQALAAQLNTLCDESGIRLILPR